MSRDELHLEHAPIVEALITIDVASLDDAAISRVESASSSFRNDYPVEEPLQQVQIQFGVDLTSRGIPQQSFVSDSSFGKKYISGDRRQLAVFRRNGFSFSRLPPYERWGTFRAEAKRLWDFYRSAVGPVSVVASGLRYINRVSIPFGKPIDEYLRLHPQMPDNPDGSMRVINSSYLRIDSVLAEPNGFLIAQQATLPPEREGFATLSLDFDLRFPSPPGSNDEYVWNTLDSARNIKNQLFVDSLTPKFLETFR